MQITSRLSAFCSQLATEDLPKDVISRAKLLVLDLLGSIIRAQRDAESTAAILRSIKLLGLGNGTARVLGSDQSYAAPAAAFINSALGHSLDFDDTHAEAIVHPGAVVIPAALAAGELCHASGATVLAGIVAGYDVACRIALALPPGEHYQRGFHPTATCGAFGATAATARVLGLDADTTASALGIALSQASGSLQFLSNGAWTKRFQVGWAAMAGLHAGVFASEGFKGAADAIEGKHGFLRAYAPAPNPERVLKDLGQVYELMNTGVKPYPSCRFGHAGIDAALMLRREIGDVQNIESVTYGVSNAGMLLVGAPLEKKANPQNTVDAQFSAPFVLAVALLTGEMGWDSYRLLQDAKVRSLVAKIRCEHDPEIEAEYPQNMSGKVTIRTNDRTYVRSVIVPKGEPSNFFQPDEVTAKFRQLAEPVIGPKKCGALIEKVLALEELNDISSLDA